jgi:hypothetical protein
VRSTVVVAAEIEELFATAPDVDAWATATPRAGNAAPDRPTADLEACECGATSPSAVDRDIDKSANFAFDTGFAACTSDARRAVLAVARETEISFAAAGRPAFAATEIEANTVPTARLCLAGA